MLLIDENVIINTAQCTNIKRKGNKIVVSGANCNETLAAGEHAEAVFAEIKSALMGGRKKSLDIAELKRAIVEKAHETEAEMQLAAQEAEQNASEPPTEASETGE